MVTCRSVLVGWVWAAACPQARVVAEGRCKRGSSGVGQGGQIPGRSEGGSTERIDPRSWRRRTEPRLHSLTSPNKDKGQEGRKRQPRCHVPSRPGVDVGAFHTKRQDPPSWPSFSGRVMVMEVKGQERGPSSPLPRAPVYSLPRQGGSREGTVTPPPGRGSRAHREEGAAEARTYRG